ncbi:MAG: gliding motility-associated C-terminal domain-containing protein [Crocinitomicaceae bacterium]|nr:gliding motility-associated C-terminal domain-containing protein [Crocinitomicaceae bacterium]
MRKVLLIVFLFLFTSVNSQQTINHHVDFASGNQNMWGPSFSAFSFNQVIPIFNMPWNVNFDTGNGGIVNILGSSFGAGVAGNFSGFIGMDFSLLGFTTGEVAVTYPVDITLDMPVDNTYDQGDLVTIETEYSVSSGYSLDTYFPSVGEARLDLNFQLGASLSATICVFGCVTFPIIPTFNTGVQNINIFTANIYGIEFFSFNGGAPLFSYGTGLPLSLPPVLGNYGLTGELDIPYVSTSHNLSGNNLGACGEDLYSNMALDIFALLGNIPGPVGLVLGNLSGSQSLGGVATLNWNFFSASFVLNNFMKQCFNFTPTVKGRFEFPFAVNFQERDPSGSIVESGTSSIVNVDLGNDLQYNFPCHFDEIDIIPTYSIDGILRNHTYDSIGFSLDMSAFEFSLVIPGITITPAINIPAVCIDIPYPCPTWSNPFKICWTEVCTPAINIPAIGWSGLNLGIGPLWSTSLPIGGFTFDLYDNTWSLEGFDEYTKPAFTMKASPLSIASNSTNILCFGDSTGSINTTINAISPALPYTYTWTNGGSTQNLSNIPAGAYQVSIYDNNGCQLFTGATITEPAQDLMLSYTKTDKSCNGGINDGSIDLLVQGGTGPYTFSWSNGASSEDVSSLDAGTYSLTVTDNVGCQKSLSVTILEPNILGQVAAITHVNCNGNNDAQIDIDVFGGTLPYFYSWSNGQLVDDIDSLNAGSYTLTVTDGKGCTSTETHIVNQPTNPLTLSSSSVDVLCFSDSTGSIDLTVTGGTVGYSFLWSSSLGTVLPFISEDVSNLPAATYTIIVTDNNGCVNQISETVNQPAQIISTPIISQINCFDDNDGAIDPNISGGVMPYSYSWSNSSNSPSISNLAAGTYTLNFSDNNLCTKSYVFTLDQPSNPLSVSIEKTDILCFGDTTGSIVAIPSGGTPGYSYSWSNGQNSNSIINLSSGVYNLILSDSNNCQVDTTIILTQPASALSLSSNVSDVLCHGDTTGSIDLDVSGGVSPYTIQWSNGITAILVDTTEDISSLPADTYIVNVLDSNACHQTLSIVVSEPLNPLSLTHSSIDAKCYGASDGEIDVAISGGTPGYSYSWSNGQTTQDVNSLQSASYTVSVTDSNGCSLAQSFIINQPSSPLSIVTNPSDVNCKNGSDGSVECFVNGGTPPYTYNWSTGQTSQNLYNLSVGSYNLTVTDGNLCTSFSGANINEPTLELLVNSLVTDVSCYSYSDGEINLSITGGTQPYYFNWGNQNEILLSNNGQTLSDLSQGNYFVRIRDENLCVNEQVITVNEPTAISVNVQTSNLLCFEDSTGAVDLSVSGGISPYTYLWSTGNTSPIITNLQSGEYEYLIIDSNACELSGTALLSQPSKLDLSYMVSPLSCIDQSDASIEIDVHGGTQPYSFYWSDGSIQKDLIDIIAGDYIINITDFNACSIIDTFNIALSYEQCVHVPNTITPNGDNYNDTWVLDNLDLYPNAIVKIFNKWGREVYSSIGQYKPWNGTKNGAPLPAAVYYYVIKLENPNNDQYTGTITIIR